MKGRRRASDSYATTVGRPLGVVEGYGLGPIVGVLCSTGSRGAQGRQ